MERERHGLRRRAGDDDRVSSSHGRNLPVKERLFVSRKTILGTVVKVAGLWL